MPSPKRWFPVNRDIVHDPDMMSMLDELGERFWRFWLACLAELDRSENRLKFKDEKAFKYFCKSLGIYMENGRKMLGKCLASNFLATLEGGEYVFPAVFESPNYWKYRKRRETEGGQKGDDSGPSHPILPYPILTKPPISPTTEVPAWKKYAEEFWQAFPKKKAKGDVEKWFAKHKPPVTEELLKCMLQKISELKMSKEWQEQNGKFIPYPASWLNAKGWEDSTTIELPKAERRLVL